MSYPRRESVELAFLAALARKAVAHRVLPTTQQSELDALGSDGTRAILEWLAEDARFTMPPLPAWFLGRADIGRFLAERAAGPNS